MFKDIALISAALLVPKALLFSLLPQAMFISNMLGSVVFTLFALSSLVAGVYLLWTALRVALYLVRAIFGTVTRIYATSHRKIKREVCPRSISRTGRYTSLRLHVK